MSVEGVGGPSISAGIEGGIAGAVSVSGHTGSFRGPAFEVAPTMPALGKGLDLFGPPMGTVNLPPAEGPAGLEGFGLEEKIMPVSIGRVDPKVEIRFNNNPLAGYAPVESVVPDVGGQLKALDWLFGSTVTIATNPDLKQQPEPVLINEPVIPEVSNAQIEPELVEEAKLATNTQNLTETAEWFTEPQLMVVPVPASVVVKDPLVQSTVQTEAAIDTQTSGKGEAGSVVMPIAETKTKLEEQEVAEQIIETESLEQ